MPTRRGAARIGVVGSSGGATPERNRSVRTGGGSIRPPRPTTLPQSEGNGRDRPRTERPENPAPSPDAPSRGRSADPEPAGTTTLPNGLAGVVPRGRMRMDRTDEIAETGIDSGPARR